MMWHDVTRCNMMYCNCQGASCWYRWSKSRDPNRPPAFLMILGACATMIKGIYLPNLGWSSVEMAKHAQPKGHRSKGASPTTHLKPNQTKWIRSSKITNWWQTLVACIITSQKYEQMRLILLYRWVGTETCTPEPPIWTPKNHMFTAFPCYK